MSSVGEHYGSISIHALRVEGDKTGHIYIRTVRISIHALRVEGDRPPGMPHTLAT